MKAEECSDSSGCCASVLSPSADIVEGANAITVTVDLPGVNQEDVQVTFEGGVLSISAQRDISSQSSAKLIHGEFESCTFKRKFALAEGLDSERISAELRNGVLTLTIPRAAKAQPKKVEIRGVH